MISLYNFTCYPIHFDNELEKKYSLPVILYYYLYFPALPKLSLVEQEENFFIYFPQACSWTTRHNRIYPQESPQLYGYLLTFFFPFCFWACDSQSPFGSSCSPGFIFTGYLLSLVNSLWALKFYA